MLKLYKNIDDVLHYHEAWKSGRTITEHWGKVGETGQTKEHPVSGNTVESVLAPATEVGFAPIENEHVLLVEFKINGMGTGADLQKRHDLEEKLNETLGWTGLGHVDGGSMGSGTMEACCFVVDFDIAKRVIEKDLAGGPFADFSRIYEEE